MIAERTENMSLDKVRSVFGLYGSVYAYIQNGIKSIQCHKAPLTVGLFFCFRQMTHCADSETKHR